MIIGQWTCDLGWTDPNCGCTTRTGFLENRTLRNSRNIQFEAYQVYLSMYPCIYVSIYVSIYLYLHTYIHNHTYMHAYIHTYVHTYILIGIYIYIYIYTYIYTYIHTYIHIDRKKIYTYIYIYIHIQTHTHTFQTIYKDILMWLHVADRYSPHDAFYRARVVGLASLFSIWGHGEESASELSYKVEPPVMFVGLWTPWILVRYKMF